MNLIAWAGLAPGAVSLLLNHFSEVTVTPKNGYDLFNLLEPLASSPYACVQLTLTYCPGTIQRFQTIQVIAYPLERSFRIGNLRVGVDFGIHPPCVPLEVAHQLGGAVNALAVHVFMVRRAVNHVKLVENQGKASAEAPQLPPGAAKILREILGVHLICQCGRESLPCLPAASREAHGVGAWAMLRIIHLLKLPKLTERVFPFVDSLL